MTGAEQTAFGLYLLLLIAATVVFDEMERLTMKQKQWVADWWPELEAAG